MTHTLDYVHQDFRLLGQRKSSWGTKNPTNQGTDQITLEDKNPNNQERLFWWAFWWVMTFSVSQTSSSDFIVQYRESPLLVLILWEIVLTVWPSMEIVTLRLVKIDLSPLIARNLRVSVHILKTINWINILAGRIWRILWGKPEKLLTAMLTVSAHRR